MWINDKRIFDSFLTGDKTDDGSEIAKVLIVGRDEGQFVALDPRDNEYVIYNPTLDKLVEKHNLGEKFTLMACLRDSGCAWFVVKDKQSVPGTCHVTVRDDNGVPVDVLANDILYTPNEAGAAKVEHTAPSVEWFNKKSEVVDG